MRSEQSIFFVLLLASLPFQIYSFVFALIGSSGLESIVQPHRFRDSWPIEAIASQCYDTGPRHWGLSFWAWLAQVFSSVGGLSTLTWKRKTDNTTL